MTGKRKMTIPSIGEIVTLATDWTFTAYAEYRNRGLMEYLSGTGVIVASEGIYGYGKDLKRYQCTLPAGLRLKVDRIYIRKGKSDYDSVTFWALDIGKDDKPFGPKRAVRFWAKLADVNTMVVGNTVCTKRMKLVEPPRIRAILLRE